MMFSTNRSLRTMETWVNFNQRIKDAIGLYCGIDHSTMCRDMGMIDELYLKKLFHTLVIKLHEKGIITGKFIFVDPIHIYAFCNTRKDTNKHGVDGASWGNLHGSFYGYKVHILIDAESELPISMIMSTGKDYDSPHFIPLLDDCMEQYYFDDIAAVLADAGYDVRSLRDSVLEKTGGIFLLSCNPKKIRVLQMMKARVKKLFKTHGENIKTVEDGFRYLGQTFLTMFGIELGDKMDNKLTEMISERFHRHLRAGVERAFSRFNTLTSYEEPKARIHNAKMVGFCFNGPLFHVLRTNESVFIGLIRKRTAFF